MTVVYIYSRGKGLIRKGVEITDYQGETYINFPLDGEYIVSKIPRTSGRISVGGVTVYTRVREFEEDMERLLEELARAMLDQSIPLPERAEWARVWLEDVPGQLEVEKFSESIEWLTRRIKKEEG